MPSSGFHRSASLPVPKDGISPEKAPYHVRSASLPCRSHPLISHLEDEVRATRAWQSAAEPEGNRSSSAWLRSGLIRLELLHLAVDDLLQVPKTRDALRGGRAGQLAETLLEDFLVFADTYGSFRAALVSLQELQSEAQVAIRRGDGAHLSSVARSLRKVEKLVAGLSSALRSVSKPVEPASGGSSAAEAELAGILREVKQVTVSASAAVFQRTAAAVASVTAAVAPKTSSSSSWTALKRRLSLAALSEKKSKGSSQETEEEEPASAKLQRLEKCVGELERGSERVFRSLMNTRVSLLNILTP